MFTYCDLNYCKCEHFVGNKFYRKALTSSAETLVWKCFRTVDKRSTVRKVKVYWIPDCLLRLLLTLAMLLVRSCTCLQVKVNVALLLRCFCDCYCWYLLASFCNGPVMGSWVWRVVPWGLVNCLHRLAESNGEDP